MNRLLGATAVLLALAVALPSIAQMVQAAIPTLIGFLVLLGIAKLAWPIRRK